MRASLMIPDRPIVRLMAAVILVILASFVPPAVQAHEGHAHHAGHGSATHTRTASVAAVPAANLAGHVARAEPLACAETAIRITAVAPIRDAGCCPGPCRVRCCGTMTCCAAGILPGPPALASIPFRAVRLVPRDAPVRTGAGPEALPRPPRTLA
ncbi:hypothetical protein mvi_00820 [Methylobacterium indicum]|uniref:Uncharacterized protein n=1 Tax=Methylobacterium indicum TaxID=1775910 RepID=A0A8H9C326_9HYPH|nr:hypothetical protein mvi_00820 [Methylobacterium indicum]